MVKVLVISFGEPLSLGVRLFAYGVPTAVKITFFKTVKQIVVICAVEIIMLHCETMHGTGTEVYLWDIGHISTKI